MHRSLSSFYRGLIQQVSDVNVREVLIERNKAVNAQLWNMERKIEEAKRFNDILITHLGCWRLYQVSNKKATDREICFIFFL